MKISDKAKGLVDYSHIYNPDFEYDVEPEFDEEEIRILEEMHEAELQEKEENARALDAWKAQAEKNLDEILYVSGAIAERLQYIFETKNIEKTSFARQIGIGRTTIHRYLSGAATPSRKKLLVIIDALDMEVADFCYEPQNFKKWKEELETTQKHTNDIFDLKESVLSSLSKNNFSYLHNGEIKPLPYRYYKILKTMLESSFRVLDLLSHDKKE